jgi:hypothetical protein
MKTTTTRCIPAALASVLLLLAPQRAVAAPPTEACSLLTQAQVSNALGVPVDPGKAPVPKSCHWDQPGKAGAGLLKLDVTITDQKAFDNRKGMRGPSTVTPVNGLGDDAFYYELASARLATLNVRKGTVVVVIRVWGGSTPVDEYKTKEKAVAGAILAKL